MAGQRHGLPRRLTDPRGLTAFHNYENPPTSIASSAHAFRCHSLSPIAGIQKLSPPKTGKGGWKREKKSGIGSVCDEQRHPGAAIANNVRTGRSPARLANFISLSGQALNFGASIIALVCERPSHAAAALFLLPCRFLSSSSTRSY